MQSRKPQYVLTDAINIKKTTNVTYPIIGGGDPTWTTPSWTIVLTDDPAVAGTKCLEIYETADPTNKIRFNEASRFGDVATNYDSTNQKGYLIPDYHKTPVVTATKNLRIIDGVVNNTLFRHDGKDEQYWLYLPESTKFADGFTLHFITGFATNATMRLYVSGSDKVNGEIVTFRLLGRQNSFTVRKIVDGEWSVMDQDLNEVA